MWGPTLITPFSFLALKMNSNKICIAFKNGQKKHKSHIITCASAAKCDYKCHWTPFNRLSLDINFVKNKQGIAKTLGGHNRHSIRSAINSSDVRTCDSTGLWTEDRRVWSGRSIYKYLFFSITTVNFFCSRKIFG